MTTTIQIELPDSTPMLEMQQFAHRLGGHLRYLAPGKYAVRPYHGNGTIVRFPKYHGQIRGADLPTEPGAA